jgi:Sec7-like guanine-nucleotide exchange factor
MLPWRQKPKGIFMTPTYNLDGSDSSHTRQGGFNFLTVMLAMVYTLLDPFVDKDRENIIYKPVPTGLSIDFRINFHFKRSVFSTPKVLRP